MFDPYWGQFFFLSKTPVVKHNTTWVSNIMLFHKKQMRQSQENVWTEGQRDPNSWEPSGQSWVSNQAK